MTPNPILKVLSTFKKNKVRSLLIGGQAAIIYGAAEFSRDSDFVILCDNDNVERLKRALKMLKAEQIYIPPLEISYLEKGHACHFRCNARDVKGLRIDIISKLRGCGQFDKLWKRKKTVSVSRMNTIDIIGLSDLVQSKKTQRDKDWLMLKRLVGNDILLNKNNPSCDKIRWWFLESRNPEALIGLGKKYPKILKESASSRPVLSAVIERDVQKIELELSKEELAERQKDVEYWRPLKKELETLRHNSGG